MYLHRDMNSVLQTDEKYCGFSLGLSFYFFEIGLVGKSQVYRKLVSSPVFGYHRVLCFTE